MKINSARFIKGVEHQDDIITDGIAQILFMGRSNVGKSSVINALTGKKDLAISSSTPGRTREINVFLINDAFYLVDLPGYGYANRSAKNRQKIYDRIDWYITYNHPERHKIVLIIDAEVGLTADDLDIIQYLEENAKEVIIVANKIDKLKSYASVKKSVSEIKEKTRSSEVIPFSAKRKTGVKELAAAIAVGINFAARIKIPQLSAEQLKFQREFNAPKDE